MSMLSFPRRLEMRLLASVPSLLTLIFALLYLVPKHVEGLSSIMPLLHLMPMFYWGMLNPRAVPYWVAFLVGLALDAVTGAPLGFSSLLYILFLALIGRQHRVLHREGFVVKWICFAILVGIVTVAGWLLLSWYHSDPQPFVPAFLQWLLTVGCYPVAHRLFDVLEEHIHTRRWEIHHS